MMIGLGAVFLLFLGTKIPSPAAPLMAAGTGLVTIGLAGYSLESNRIKGVTLAVYVIGFILLAASALFFFLYIFAVSNGQSIELFGFMAYIMGLFIVIFNLLFKREVKRSMVILTSLALMVIGIASFTFIGFNPGYDIYTYTAALPILAGVILFMASDFQMRLRKENKAERIRA